MTEVRPQAAPLRAQSDDQVWLVFWMGRRMADRETARQELLRRGVVHKALEWPEGAPNERGRTWEVTR